MPGPVFPPNNAVFDQNASVVKNGMTGTGPASYVDAQTGGGTYTCPVNVNVVLPASGWPLAGFIQINAGQPYQFTAAQAAQLIAAGVTLNAT